MLVNMHTYLHAHAHRHTHTTWRMQYRASYTAQWLDVVLEQICYIYTPAWLEHLLKPSVKRHSIYLWQREGNNTIYTNLALGGGDFQLMDNFFFFFTYFTIQFPKWPPFRGTDESRSQAATHMQINSITSHVKKQQHNNEVAPSQTSLGLYFTMLLHHRHHKPNKMLNP